MRRKSIRQVVEDPQPDEYYVLVTRYYPMELRKRRIKLADSPLDVWDRDLAPSKALLFGVQTNQIGWAEYEKRFRMEIPTDFVLKRLAKHKKDAKGKTVVLVCIEEDSEYPRCHTWLLLNEQTVMSEKEPLRCGLCNIIVKGSFADHVKSDLHQSNMPKVERVKLPVVPVREVSEAEKKQNRDKTAKAENLGYYSVANGRSYYHVRCECGETSDVFAWRGCKRCSNCGKVIVIHWMLSFKESS